MWELFTTSLPTPWWKNKRVNRMDNKVRLHSRGGTIIDNNTLRGCISLQHAANFSVFRVPAVLPCRPNNSVISLVFSLFVCWNINDTEGLELPGFTNIYILCNRQNELWTFINDVWRANTGNEVRGKRKNRSAEVVVLEIIMLKTYR